LATEFLTKGGTFVTKVFRSKDYNKLLWVFQQLFRKVEATKPPSSRNVSAEIFVVCRDFIAPKKIDPRILDPKSVFSDEGAEEAKKVSDIFKPEKKARQREGYEDGNYTLFKSLDVMEFVRSPDPITTLGSYNRFTFESDEARELMKRDLTTEDVKENCQDLKVLGKSDFKVLLKWRSTLREEYKMDKKAEEKANAVAVEEESMDEDELLEAEIASLTKEEASKKKREKRKSNEKKMKLIQRMQLNMIIPTDIALDDQAAGEEIFNIKKIGKEEALRRLEEGDMSLADDLDDDDDQPEDINVPKNLRGRIREMDYDANGEIVDSDEEYERELEDQMDENYARYKTKKAEKDAKFRAKQMREEQDEWHGFDAKRNKQDKDEDKERDTKFDSDSDSSDSSDDSDNSSSDGDSDDSLDEEQQEAPKKKKQINIPKKKTNSLMNDLGEKTALSKKTASGLTKSASMFFDQDIFQDVALDELVVEEGDSSDEEPQQQNNRKANLKRKRAQEASDDGEESDFDMEPTEDAVPSDEEMWDGNEDDNSKAMKKALGK
jgi:AdoMet-dependent rRNA methyltransferase SPB1